MSEKAPEEFQVAESVPQGVPKVELQAAGLVLPQVVDYANTPEAIAKREKRAEWAKHTPKSSQAEVNEIWKTQDEELRERLAEKPEQVADPAVGERWSQIERYNDAAEFRLFGSRGRTYYESEDVNQEHYPIATSVFPEPGLVDGAKRRADSMNFSYSERQDLAALPQPERKRMERQRKKEMRAVVKEAEEYVKGVLDLQAQEDLSLSQAEFIMTARHEDNTTKAGAVTKRAQELMERGFGKATATRQAGQEVERHYARKDAMRLKIAKENDLHTYDEYRAFTASKQEAARQQAAAEAARVQAEADAAEAARQQAAAEAAKKAEAEAAKAAKEAEAEAAKAAKAAKEAEAAEAAKKAEAEAAEAAKKAEAARLEREEQDKRSAKERYMAKPAHKRLGRVLREWLSTNENEHTIEAYMKREDAKAAEEARSKGSGSNGERGGSGLSLEQLEAGAFDPGVSRRQDRMTRLVPPYEPLRGGADPKTEVLNSDDDDLIFRDPGSRR